MATPTGSLPLPYIFLILIAARHLDGALRGGK